MRCVNLQGTLYNCCLSFLLDVHIVYKWYLYRKISSAYPVLFYAFLLCLLQICEAKARW